VVNRWRAQTFNPDSLFIPEIPAGAAAPATPAGLNPAHVAPTPRSPLRRESFTPSGAQLGPGATVQPAPGATVQPAPGAQPAGGNAATQPSLASLIRQFRT